MVITPDSNPYAKVLVVQDFAYGKYLGRLKVDFDADGEVTKWSGNPILLDNSIQKDPAVLQQVQQMKNEVSKVSEVRDNFFNSFVSRTCVDCKTVVFFANASDGFTPAQGSRLRRESAFRKCPKTTVLQSRTCAAF